MSSNSHIVHRPRLRLLLAASAIATLLPAAAQRSNATLDAAQAERLIIERSNAYRNAQGAAPTAPNATLTAAARGFAEYLVRTHQMDHEADGHTPAERARAQGYDYCMVAENLAYLQSTIRYGAEEVAERFVQGWIESPGHRHNLVNSEATETAVAVVRDASGTRTYAVQMFGRPGSLRVRFEISNRSDQVVRYQIGDQRYTLAPRVIREHEQCLNHPVVVELPGQKSAATLAPRDGGSYRVEPSAKGLRLVEG